MLLSIFVPNLRAHQFKVPFLVRINFDKKIFPVRIYCVLGIKIARKIFLLRITAPQILLGLKQLRLFQFRIEAEGCQREWFFFNAMVDCISATEEQSFAGADQKTERHAHQASEQHRVNVLFSANLVCEILSVLDAAIRTASGDSDRDAHNHARSDC